MDRYIIRQPLAPPRIQRPLSKGFQILIHKANFIGQPGRGDIGSGAERRQDDDVQISQMVADQETPSRHRTMGVNFEAKH